MEFLPLASPFPETDERPGGYAPGVEALELEQAWILLAPIAEVRMTRFAEVVYALLRILTGLLFASHGAQKLFGLFGSPRMVDSPLLVTAGVIELVCGLAVAAGFLARPAAFLASGEMAVAYFMKHAPQSFWPIQNHGESAVLYCFLFLLVTASGAGIWSVDGLRRTEHEAAEPAAPAMATRSPV